MEGANCASVIQNVENIKKEKDERTMVSTTEIVKNPFYTNAEYKFTTQAKEQQDIKMEIKNPALPTKAKNKKKRSKATRALRRNLKQTLSENFIQGRVPQLCFMSFGANFTNFAAMKNKQFATKVQPRSFPPTPKKSTLPKETKSIQVYIVPPSRGSIMWTFDQMKIIQTCLLNKIAELRNGFIKPKFNSFYFYEGCISIGCADKATTEWLKSVVETLKPWTKAELCLIEATADQNFEIFIGHFEIYEIPSNEYIFKLIEGQNQLDTKKWQVLNRQNLSQTVQLILSLDAKSAQYLHAHNHAVNFGFSQARIAPASA